MTSVVTPCSFRTLTVPDQIENHEDGTRNYLKQIRYDANDTVVGVEFLNIQKYSKPSQQRTTQLHSNSACLIPIFDETKAPDFMQQ
jgi:hypothetical protein